MCISHLNPSLLLLGTVRSLPERETWWVNLKARASQQRPFWTDARRRPTRAGEPTTTAGLCPTARGTREWSPPDRCCHGDQPTDLADGAYKTGRRGKEGERKIIWAQRSWALIDVPIPESSSSVRFFLPGFTDQAIFIGLFLFSFSKDILVFHFLSQRDTND